MRTQVLKRKDNLSACDWRFEIQKISKLDLARFAKRFGVKLIILFGSSLDPRRVPGDIDAALLISKGKREKYQNNIDAYTKFWLALGKALGVSPDVLDITFLSPHLSPLVSYTIAREGKLLYGERSRFIAFQSEAVKTFWDTTVFRQALDTYLEHIIIHAR